MTFLELLTDTLGLLLGIGFALALCVALINILQDRG